MFKQILMHFCEALKTIGDSWMMNSEWMDKATLNMYNNNEHHNSERIGMFRNSSNI